MNLLQETKDALVAHGKRPVDVMWVGDCDGTHSLDWDGFCKLADVDYDNGFGAQEVAKDLVVVGVDWWLSRSEYDGSEWWSFESKPVLAKSSRLPTRLVVTGKEGGWLSLGEMDDPWDICAGLVERGAHVTKEDGDG